MVRHLHSICVCVRWPLQCTGMLWNCEATTSFSDIRSLWGALVVQDQSSLVFFPCCYGKKNINVELLSGKVYTLAVRPDMTIGELKKSEGFQSIRGWDHPDTQHGRLGASRGEAEWSSFGPLRFCTRLCQRAGYLQCQASTWVCQPIWPLGNRCAWHMHP